MDVPKTNKKISVSFFQNDNGKMPVREWLKSLSSNDKKIIGEDIKTVEFGWPIGMPTTRPLGNGLYEVRSTLTNGDESRILFTIIKNKMILLHGFIKKSQKTKKNDLNIARKRMQKFSQEKQKGGGK